MANKDLKVIEPKQEFDNQLDVLIKHAIDNNSAVDVMERLLLMRTQLKDEYAKEAFDEAMSNFQAECPVVEKTKSVLEKDGRTARYKFAPIDSIVSQVKETIARNGLSYIIKISNDDKNMTVTCKVTHKLGHSEESSFVVPIGTESYMSDVQKFGARSTFAKRYAFCNAFGILTGDEDNDAVEQKVGAGPKYVATTKKAINITPVNKTDQQKITIFKLLKELGENPIDTTEACEVVHFITGIELKEENFTDIIERLESSVHDSDNSNKKPIEQEIIKIAQFDGGLTYETIDDKAVNNTSEPVKTSPKPVQTATHDFKPASDKQLGMLRGLYSSKLGMPQEISDNEFWTRTCDLLGTLVTSDDFSTLEASKLIDRILKN